MAKRSKLPKGKVIRISEEAAGMLASIKDADQSWPKLIDELLDSTTGPTFWVLPSELSTTKKQAQTKALQKAAEQNLSFEDREIPMQIRVSE